MRESTSQRDITLVTSSSNSEKWQAVFKLIQKLWYFLTQDVDETQTKELYFIICVPVNFSSMRPSACLCHSAQKTYKWLNVVNIWPWPLTFRYVVRVFFDNKNNYNLKTCGHILIQFFAIVCVKPRRFYKCKKSWHLLPLICNSLWEIKLMTARADLCLSCRVLLNFIKCDVHLQYKPLIRICWWVIAIVIKIRPCIPKIGKKIPSKVLI